MSHDEIVVLIKKAIQNAPKSKALLRDASLVITYPEIAEFVTLVREQAFKEVAEYLDTRQYYGLAERVKTMI